MASVAANGGRGPVRDTIPRVPGTPELVLALPSPKRVRARVADRVIADSRRTLLLRANHFLPVYYFPREDVLEGLLREQTARDRDELGGETVHYSIVAAGHDIKDAAWSFPAPADPRLAALRDHVAFRWSAVDAWFEEEDEVFVHARDPYARIDILHGGADVVVRQADRVIAQSRRPTLLFETHLPTRLYLPAEDVRLDLLERSETTSRCPYKGIASYWAARQPDGGLRDIAWTYLDPIPEAVAIKGLIAFYPQRVDSITRDGEPMT